MMNKNFILRVVITHTDFRIYWPARIRALQQHLKHKGINMEIIEIAGKGSPYEFVKSDSKQIENWHILFPNERMENIPSPDAYRSLWRKLDEINPDVVMAGAIAFPSGATAINWAKRKNRSVVIFDNARLEDVPRSRLINIIKKAIYRNVDAILCPSPALDPSFTYWGFKKEQLFYGVNCVDNAFFERKNDLQQSNNLPGRYILTVGRLVPKKNFKFLLEAYQVYCESCKSNPLHLVLVGEGEELNTLKDYVSNHQLNSVHFFPFAPQEELRRFYWNASIFILPSKYGETWGLVVNEAMAAKLPVLVSKQCGCASTLVEPSANGFTFDPENKDELVDYLHEFHNFSTVQLENFGEKSKSIIDQWGLDQFCKGSFDAIQYAFQFKKKSGKIFDKIILKFWKGRYRPT